MSTDFSSFKITKEKKGMRCVTIVRPYMQITFVHETEYGETFIVLTPTSLNEGDYFTEKRINLL